MQLHRKAFLILSIEALLIHIIMTMWENYVTIIQAFIEEAAKQRHNTGGGQILCTRREVLPVADYIFAVNKCKYFPSISWENGRNGTLVCSNRKSSATGSTSLPIRRLCPPTVIKIESRKIASRNLLTIIVFIQRKNRNRKMSLGLILI